MRAAAWLTCLCTTPHHMDSSNIDYRKEAWGLILRSAQKHFSEGTEKISDSQIHGIKVMSLRLQSNTARSLYGTKYLPVLGTDDPMKTQLIRKAHETEHGAGRLMHNLEKTTLANLVQGPVGATWKTERRDIMNYVKYCGVCLKFKGLKCTPPLGKSLFRTKACVYPFGHTSMDPVGHIRVKGRLIQRKKVYPLILACLETGGLHVEIMEGMEAKDVYLSILRLQYRFNTRVLQLFSDGGSQLNAKLLGKKRNY